MLTLQSVLCGVECRACLTDLLTLQNRLNFLRALGGLDQDEAQDVAPRQRDRGTNPAELVGALVSWLL